MKFKKAKRPKTLKLGESEYFTINDNDACAYLRVGYPKVGPRQAIKMARWLERYAKWSSLAAVLLLASCASVEKQADIPPAKETAPIQKCAKNSFCWDQVVMDKITDNMLAANVSSFCPKASKLDRKEVWLNIVKSIIWAESSWNPETTYTETAMGIDPVTKKQVVSEGLFQLSYQDARNWSSLPQCKQIDYVKRNIRDVAVNIGCGMAIMNRLAVRGKQEDISSRKFLGAYWSAVWIGKTRSRGMMKKLLPSCGL